MSFIIILVAVVLQFFFKIYSAPYRTHWATPYFKWLEKRVEILTKGHGLFGVLLFIVPVLIVASLVFTLVYHLLGYIGYVIVSLALFWYCLDLHTLQGDERDSKQVFLSGYHGCFALFFWYFVFGPVGLVLYVIVRELLSLLQTQEAQYPDLLKHTALTLGVLDWVPVRLLGISFALAGHFGAVFKSWLAALGDGVKTEQPYIVDWGFAALSAGESSDSAVSDIAQVRALLVRSACLWLVVIALLSFI